MKKSFLQSTSVSDEKTTKLLKETAEIFESRLVPPDLNHSYLQNTVKPMRNLFIKPLKKLNLDLNQLLKLSELLYRVTESVFY